jgi:DNA-binding transcriptional ArsR family regulator
MPEDAGEPLAGGRASHEAPPAEADVELALDVAGLLSEPIRLSILCELLASPRSVTELWTTLQLPQPTVSHHLSLLRDAGLVRRRRVGRIATYQLGPAAEADGDTLVIRAGVLQVEWRIRCP